LVYRSTSLLRPGSSHNGYSHLLSLSSSNAPASPEIYPLSLHDALPIWAVTFHDRTDGSEVDVLALEGAALRTFRWKKVAMVFQGDRKSTRLNSSHVSISYAVFCLKKNTSSSCAWLCLGNRHSTGTE